MGGHTQKVPPNIITAMAADVWPVRHAAYFPDSPDRPLSLSQETGDEDPTTTHFGLIGAGKIVGVATMMDTPSPRTENSSPWRLRGMAVLPEHQGHGYGADLLNYCVSRIAHNGGGLLWGNIRFGAYEFYQKFNFNLAEDVFYAPSGTPHRYGELLIPAIQS